MLERTTSGGVTVNDVIMHVSMEDLPFGGVGPAAWAPITASTASARSATPRQSIASRGSTSRVWRACVRSYGEKLRAMMTKQIKGSYWLRGGEGGSAAPCAAVRRSPSSPSPSTPLQPHLALVRLDEGAHQREAEPGALLSRA